MSNIKYNSELYILVDHREQGFIERINIPVHSFEVEGGANRKINLAASKEMSILSEFEQARTYTNFIFYIPPTKDFLALKLINLRKNFQLFRFSFVVSMFSNGRIIQAFEITSKIASFKEPPTLIGDGSLLMAKVRLVKPELRHGSVDAKSTKFIPQKI